MFVKKDFSVWVGISVDASLSCTSDASTSVLLIWLGLTHPIHKLEFDTTPPSVFDTTPQSVFDIQGSADDLGCPIPQAPDLIRCISC